MNPSNRPRRRVGPANLPGRPDRLSDAPQPGAAERLERDGIEDDADDEAELQEYAQMLRDAGYDPAAVARVLLAGREMLERRQRKGPAARPGLPAARPAPPPALPPARRGGRGRGDRRDPHENVWGIDRLDAEVDETEARAARKTALPAHTMTKTEVSLRLARFLDAERLVSSEISVSLTGDELTKQDRPHFPVVDFLAERQLHRVRGGETIDDWRGVYQMKGDVAADSRPCPVVLHSSPIGGDLVATLRSGSRLVVFVSRGSLAETRSPAEHNVLRRTIGRAVTETSTDATDVLAVAVPRSRRFTQCANEWRSAEGIRRSGVVILTVDRAGSVHGFPTEGPRTLGSSISRWRS